MWPISDESNFAESDSTVVLSASVLGQISLSEILRINSALIVERTEQNLSRLQPLQQALIARLVEGAYGKKLKPSFLANSANASAMPSPVKPSWLNRSCLTIRWPWLSSSGAPSGPAR